MKQGIFVVLLIAVSTAFASLWNESAFFLAQGEMAKKKKEQAFSRSVGSCHGGGVVFYVNTNQDAPSGQHGLIVALADATTGCASPTGTCEWDTNGYTPKIIAPHTDYFTGAKNTKEILKALGSSRAQAAYAASQYRGGGYADWYLPAQKELMMLYTQLSSKGDSFWTRCGGSAPAAGSYWSSTQVGTSVAWGIAFVNGNVPYGVTTSTLGVRAVRAF